jgi:hypothetical protein
MPNAENALSRSTFRQAVTEEVAQEMADAGYAYWSSYDSKWLTKRPSNVEGIVGAVMRALERRSVTLPPPLLIGREQNDA